MATLLKFGQKDKLKYGVIDIHPKFKLNLTQPAIINLSNEYAVLEKKISPFIEYENLNNQLIYNLQENNLADLSQLMVRYNILDLEIWRNFFDKFEESNLPLDQLSIIFQSLTKFILNRFRNEKPRGFEYYYHEQDLQNIFNHQQLEGILKKIHKKESDNEYVNVIRMLMDLYGKLSRVTNVNYYNFNQVLEEKCKNLKYENLTLHNLVALYQIYGEKEELTQLIFEKYEDSAIYKILEIWKQQGQYNEKIFSIMKDTLIKDMDLWRVFSLLCSNVQDPQIIQACCYYLDISEKSIMKMKNNEQNAYLISLKLLQIRYPQYDVPKRRLRPLNINRTQKKSVSEELLITYIKQYLLKLDEEVQITIDERVWLYIVDIGLVFRDKKVALELSGYNYYRENKLSGKKQAKKEILISEGWVPIFLGSSEKAIFEKFSFKQKEIPQQFEQLFDILLEEVLGRKLKKK